MSAIAANLNSGLGLIVVFHLSRMQVREAQVERLRCDAAASLLGRRFTLAFDAMTHSGEALHLVFGREFYERAF